MPADLLRYGIGWIAASLGLVPLAWLMWLHATGRVRDVAWWWIAAAFAVSFLADVAAFVLAPSERWIVGAVYPLSQAALIGFVFLVRRDAMRFLAVLFVVGVAAVLWRGVTGPDVLLRTVAWGTVAGIVLDRWALGRLRVALLTAFGLGLLCRWGYALWPGWWSYGAYQGVRALGAGLFCWAALAPGAHLRLDTMRDE